MTALTSLRVPIWAAAAAGIALGGLAGVHQSAQAPEAAGTTAAAAVLAQQASEDASPLDPEEPGTAVEGDTLQDAVLEIDANDVVLQRDPFDPVVSSQFTTATADGGTTDGDAAADTSGDETTTTGGTVGDVVGGDGATGDCDVSASEAVCDGTVVALTDVDDDGTITVSVAGARTTAVEGDTLAGGAVLVGPVDAPCAAFAYGVEVFQLCAGSLK